MKITTLNLKNANYVEHHEIYVGTHTGSFKKLITSGDHPHAQVNLQNIKSLDKSSRITVLEYNDEASAAILLGRTNDIVQTFDTNTCSYQEIKFPESEVVGLGRWNTNVIAGFANGKIRISTGCGFAELHSGDNMSRLRQCKTNKSFIATGGKDRQNNLKIFDLEKMETVFSSKNLPNDYLQLEVPTWDTDISFIDSHTVVTCSRYGYVRLYDTRIQRRPILKYAQEDMSFSCLVAKDHMVYVGTTTGGLKAFDTRNLRNFVHTYKGFTGGLSNLCLDASGSFLASACLDRCVRVHHTENCILMYQCYVKSKVTGVLLRNREVVQDADNDAKLRAPQCEDVKNDKDEEYDAMFDNMEAVNDEDDVQEMEILTKRKRKQTEKKVKKKKAK